ncbi:hypothetical protein BDY19DRAFT_907909 [Irpex rosettiformis]|uniref:Uncharacterized protein n=1 Tax=Irpex rosettiformis TaxID=378272 RepID=A0ACB8TYJ0_9APHY|nr:hypothetical protein BDY19DRAFT_907909 [Irpex rosettiformis]
MSTRPRPRPKPRPRVVSTAPPSSPGVPLAASPIEPVVIDIDDDDDARFFKNRNRTLQSWKKLDKLAEEQESKRTKAPSPVPNEDNEDLTPRRRKHKKVENDVLPSWTKDPKAALISSDEDSDDDIVEIVAPSSSPSTARRRIDKSKRKRSRSRSLTPPPALPTHTLEYARETVRRMLGGNVRAASPTFIEENSFDNVELNPELAKIAMEAKRQSSLHPGHSRSPSPEVGGGPPTVALKVRWKKHPQNPGGKDGVWAFHMKRHDSFSILFSEVADIAGVLMNNVIITYKGNRVFSSASPHDAYDKQTFEYLQKNRHRSPGPSNALNAVHQSRESSPAGTEGDDSAAASEAEEDAEDDDRLKITLRAASLKSLNLTVRQTTKCSAILRAFLKYNNLSEKYPSSPTKGKKGKKGKSQATGPALVVDGDRLSPDDEISVADLEDGDMVEVVGL